MIESFRFKCRPQKLNAATIKQLRNFVDFGIDEIKLRAEQRLTLLEYPIFNNDWQENRKIIKKLLDFMNAGQLPLEVYRHTVFDDDSLLEEQLTIQDAYEALIELQRIELEQDMLSQLEAGHIASRDEYIQNDEDDQTRD